MLTGTNVNWKKKQNKKKELLLDRNFIWIIQPWSLFARWWRSNLWNYIDGDAAEGRIENGRVSSYSVCSRTKMLSFQIAVIAFISGFET